MSVNTLLEVEVEVINNDESVVTTRQLINNDKRRAKSALDDDECIVKLDGELDVLSQLDFCPFKNGRHQTCSCLHVLRDPNIRWSVSKYLLAFFKKDKFHQDTVVIDWYRYATDGCTAPKSKKLLFHLPFDATDLPSGDIHYNVLLKTCHTAKVCTSSLMALLQLGRHAWQTIVNEAKTTGVAKPHGNIGNKNPALSEDSELMKFFCKYMEELKDMGEVRATRSVEILVAGEVVGHTNRDHAIEDIYLPMCLGYRPCYGRYLAGLGFKYEPNSDGTYTTSALEADIEAEVVVGDNTKKFLHFSTFFRIWKRDYPTLKVSKPIQDICEQCFCFAHRSKFLVTPRATSTSNFGPPSKFMLNSSIDDTLFQNFSELCLDDNMSIDNNNDSNESDLEEIGSIESTDDPLISELVSTEEEPAPTEESTIGGDVDDDEVTEDGAEAPDDADESREKMMLRMGTHVQMARVQRELYRHYVNKAINDAEIGALHSERSYTFVVDYGQNMELPVFNHEQPGCAYYYSPLSVYNLGVVNHAHKYGQINSDGNVRNEYKEHMHAHVYHEGVAKKGANNVASLIMKTLTDSNILRENDPGGELVIVFDNCSGQNKNNTMLKLLVYLTEIGYFKRVTFVFLIVGHTKNAADRLFNMLKRDYRLKNIFTMDCLMDHLNVSESVTIHPTLADDFFDYESFLDMFYSDFKSKVKQHHIFSCNYNSSRVGNKINVELRESNLDIHPITTHNAIKAGFFGRTANYAKGSKGLREAIMKRPTDIARYKAEYLRVIEPPSINIYKRVELHTKYKPIVPIEFQNDIIYEEPPQNVIDAVKAEKKSRGKFKKDLNAEKKKVSRKLDEMLH